MKKIEVYVDDHDSLEFKVAIRTKREIILLLIKSIRLFLLSNYDVLKKSNDKLIVNINKMNRIFFFSKEKYFSFCFPFNFEQNENNLEIKYKDYKIDFKVLSILETLILSKKNLVLSEDEILKVYLENIDEENGDKELENINNFIQVVNRLIEFEPGYLRYDYDPNPSRLNEDKHPLNHLDINFESNNTFKIGLRKEISVESFIDMLDITTNCHFLNHKNNI
ncbi:hypothetical protein ACSXBY_16770 (plasmid) [Clostridium perfringens]|uniref:hypothetical protein n=3 Tax=Clostridium perfringens TaxID=1502 RepID=UPI0001665630|nr:hypothetical protein [Clostridium perfringens]EDS79636.1 conserved hypothetical protein [Clostridium perfringens C str. JGS1495]MBI6030753.1 hypothetical protein [Clostridium perfringens]MBI6034073.1 hypothetical protein [Clostridium perfringens]MBI6069149.1 hypothetical protein [Clostridium perfringens]MBI6097464.1 hypothetical protein [Clostridium perfringens]